MSWQRVSASQLAELREELTGRDLAILGQVADLRLMSGRQIASVHFPVSEHDSAGAAKRARNRVLGRLVRDRLLVRTERRVGGVRSGSNSFIYALGGVGHRLLTLDGTRPRLHEPGPTFAAHTLAVAQFVVDCTLAAQQKRFDVIVCQAEPRCWRRFTSASGLVLLRPDLFLALGIGDYEHRFFIEIDLGTEHLPALVRKCSLYQSYYVSGREQAAHGVSPRTCWIVPDEARAERLRRAIHDNRKLSDQLFVVTTTERALAVLSGGAS